MSNITDCVNFVAFLPSKVSSMLCLKSISASLALSGEYMLISQVLFR